MAVNIVKDVYSKAEEVLFTDKLKSPNKINDILSSEIYYVLKQYFEMKDNSFSSRIYTEHNGDVSISFSFKAKRILIKHGFGVNE